MLAHPAPLRAQALYNDDAVVMNPLLKSVIHRMKGVGGVGRGRNQYEVSF